MTAANDTGQKCGKWFKCKGCGKAIGFFPDGLPGKLAPGSVAHWKPSENLGKVGTVPCSLFNQLDAGELARLHVDAEPWPDGNATGMEPYFE